MEPDEAPIVFCLIVGTFALWVGLMALVVAVAC